MKRIWKLEAMETRMKASFRWTISINNSWESAKWYL